jgi:hypothetical protein
LSETPSLAQKEIIQILKQNGLCRDLDYKSTLEFYLSCALELLETHRLSNNFQPFYSQEGCLVYSTAETYIDQVEKISSLS